MTKIVSNSRLTERGHSRNEFTWVHDPVRVNPVAQKLSMMEERCQEKNCLFSGLDYRDEDYNPKILSWV
jgi:hypothetical protein